MTYQMRILVSKRIKDSALTLISRININIYRAGLGIVKSTVAYWRANNSVIPKQDILLKIANYFNVSVDYLLGNEEKEPTPNDSDETLLFALYGGDSKDITPGMLDDVRRFAQFIREKEKEKEIGK